MARILVIAAELSYPRRRQICTILLTGVAKNALASRVSNSFKKCCHPERSEGPAFQQFVPPVLTWKYVTNFRLRTLVVSAAKTVLYVL